jgi:hypothetical protein
MLFICNVYICPLISAGDFFSWVVLMLFICNVYICPLISAGDFLDYQGTDHDTEKVSVSGTSTRYNVID